MLTKGNTSYIIIDGQNLIKSTFGKDKSSTKFAGDMVSLLIDIELPNEEDESQKVKEKKKAFYIVSLVKK